MLHQNDGPAIIDADGSQKWYVHGRFHREDGPAVINKKDKAEGWYRHGVAHREDGPAKIINGLKEYWIDGREVTQYDVYTVDGKGAKKWENEKGQLHRLNGPAIECANGDKAWFKDGRRHREDGPAIEHANGDKWWYRNGRQHREDGPAIIRFDGTVTYYLKGVEIPAKEYFKTHSCIVPIQRA